MSSDSSVGRELDADQLSRLGVTDGHDCGALQIGSRVRVTHAGLWHGQVGTVRRIKIDDSGSALQVSVCVDLDGGPVVFGIDALEDAP